MKVSTGIPTSTTMEESDHSPARSNAERLSSIKGENVTFVDDIDLKNDNDPEETTFQAKANAEETEREPLESTDFKFATVESADEVVLNEDEEASQVTVGPPKRQKLTCKTCCKKCCPHFPLCCPLPLHNCLQLLAIVDLFVVAVNTGIWLYLNQYDPFSVDRKIPVGRVSSTTASSRPKSSTFDYSEFHETTTLNYDPNLDQSDTEKVHYSKIGHVYHDYQQEVENLCGSQYYKEILFGQSLIITNGVFLDLLITTYITELMYLVIDASVLVTTCCYFEYTSGRFFLIILWNMELLPVLGKLYVIVESRSQRLCIFQYGLGRKIRGLDVMLIFHFIPLMIFRAYILVVFTYFVKSLLELGNLEHLTRIQGATLRDYVDKQKEYLRMDKNRGLSSSSENDDADIT